MSHYPRPEEPTITQEKEVVAGTCAQCGKEELCRYPVLSEQGWVLVVRCQACLHCVSREPWHLLGYVELLSEQV